MKKSKTPIIGFFFYMIGMHILFPIMWIGSLVVLVGVVMDQIMDFPPPEFGTSEEFFASTTFFFYFFYLIFLLGKEKYKDWPNL